MWSLGKTCIPSVSVISCCVTDDSRMYWLGTIATDVLIRLCARFNWDGLSAPQAVGWAHASVCSQLVAGCVLMASLTYVAVH